MAESDPEGKGQGALAYVALYRHSEVFQLKKVQQLSLKRTTSAMHANRHDNFDRRSWGMAFR